MLICLMLLSGCAAETPIGTVAVYEEYQAELLDAVFFTDDDGKRMITVNMRYTNKGVDAMYLLESFVVRAYQAETSLTDCTDINEEVSLIQEVKDGASIEAGYTFELTTKDNILVNVCTPTAEEQVLAEKEYAYGG